MSSVNNHSTGLGALAAALAPPRVLSLILGFLSSKRRTVRWSMRMEPSCVVTSASEGCTVSVGGVC